MKNVTLSLPDGVARWARIWAAEHDTSVSKIVGQLLEQRMKAAKGYQSAMSAFLKRKPVQLKREGRYPSRESMHER